MKVVSLNIRHGGGPRCEAIAAWVLAQAAYFLLLAEWRDGAQGAELKEGIQRAGYSIASENRTPGTNGLLVGSKRPFKIQRLTPPNSTSGEIVAGDLECGIHALCCYFPQGVNKKPFVAGPLLILGDLNTGSNGVDKQPGGTKYYCADQFANLTKSCGLVDLWRSCNGSNTQEWTWHSTKNGFRIDHAFGNLAFNAQTKGLTCRYDHLLGQAAYRTIAAWLLNLCYADDILCQTSLS